MLPQEPSIPQADPPRHVAIIMDGNGRWAKKRLLPRSVGHSAGMKRMIALCDHAFSRGVRMLTLFALSTENLLRPKDEVEALFELFREYFKTNLEKLQKNGVVLRVIGDLARLPEDIRLLIGEGQTATKDGKAGTLVLAIAYGARADLVAAANKAVRAGKEVDEETFSAYLSTAALPAPDLLIRTGKEKRLSNFLLWELAYTELYFSDKMFPAFSNRDFDRALDDFSKRERRFGKI